MAGIQYRNLNSLCRNIWHWCEDRQLFIFASYISSKENKVADIESRQSYLETEWELNEKYFHQIVNQVGKPDIDLFATRINAKCAIIMASRSGGIHCRCFYH